MKNMKNSTKYMIGSMLSWVLPILIFGEVHNLTQYLMLPISTIIMGFLINYKWNTTSDRFFSPNYYFSFVLGILLPTFKLSPFVLIHRDTIISLTVDTSFSIIGWWVCIALVTIFAVSYRQLKKSEYLQQFDDLGSMVRDTKINQIVGKWWK